MRTLLEAYIAQQPPEEWSNLFKEAANVAFMVKYMFRENLPLAKQHFGRYIEDKTNFLKIPHAAKQKEILTALVHKTFDAYGDVGIFDPEKLATIDFLNQPELLLALVSESTGDGMVRRRRPAACTCPWRRRSEPPTAKGRWSLLQLQKADGWSLQLQEAGWSVGWPAFTHAMCVSDPSSVHSRST